MANDDREKEKKLIEGQWPTLKHEGGKGRGWGTMSDELRGWGTSNRLYASSGGRNIKKRDNKWREGQWPTTTPNTNDRWQGGHQPTTTPNDFDGGATAHRQTNKRPPRNIDGGATARRQTMNSGRKTIGQRPTNRQ